MTLERFRALAASRARAGRTRARVARHAARHGYAGVGLREAAPAAPFAFLLESAPAGSETWSRYTFMGTEPRAAWRLQRDGTVQDWTAERGWHADRRPADPLADLQRLIARDVPVSVPELGEFWAGAVGYFAYDMVRHIERLPPPPPARLEVPDALFVFTRAVVIIDNLRAQARVVVGVQCPPRATMQRWSVRMATPSTRSSARLHVCARPLPLPALDLDPDAPPAEGRSTLRARSLPGDVTRSASTSWRATASRRCWLAAL